ncbi:MAG: sigma-70 family RNA polymerase sigma factor [Nitrospira sp.]|nr:sigma-70 family RNA polymerase sigma factor [Nitrospira sp.]MCP9443119.1 sigma-70 family RNA polymerase sigma factor [Nitrospira sp.]
MRQDLEQAASTIDPVLLSRAVKGDHQAFSRLYDLSGTLLYSLALKILGNREDAAGLLQEIYLEILKKTARYDVGRGTPIVWLITLTRNRAIDRLRTGGVRAKGRAAPLLNGSTTERATDQPSGSFDARADQELRQLILAAAAGLPPAQREAIEMAYYAGLSYVEIASRLNLPPETVKTRIKLAMTKLREALGEGEERHTRS